VYEGDNTFYMVMDLLEGKSLHDELTNHKTGLPLDICRSVMFVIENSLYLNSKANTEGYRIYALIRYYASGPET
jgi:calcium-dependent protein kinase